MSNESIVLASSISSTTEETVFTEKQKAAGYHNVRSSMHTAVYLTDDFVGNIRLQGTLSLFPTESDWVDIHDSEFFGDSTTNSFYVNFDGNFTFLRAAYFLESGLIQEIRYNH